jgi:hypothetical protein
MATVCPLTTGFPYECDENTGGLKPGEFLVTQWENVKDGITVVAGEITVMTQVALTNFYRYSLDKETTDFVSTETHDPLLGSIFYESVINAVLFNMSKEKNVELKLLAGKPLVIIVQDLNDIYHCFGVQSGAEKAGGTNQAASGKEYGTMNGYTMGFTAKDTNLYTVASAVVASLVIAGESS